MSAAGLPPVAVVIPTHERPLLLRRAVDAVLAQDYEGQIDVLVVHDQSPPDRSLEVVRPGRSVSVVGNDRTPGLAGARNTGVSAATHDLVAFCDDDDEWRSGKLTAQVAAMSTHPGAEMCCTGISVQFQGRRTDRLVGADLVEHRQLLRSRMAMLHSSTFLLRRSALMDGIGLLDEAIPGGQNEDWDLLLRASRRQPVVVVDRPLVDVLWSAGSFYARRWDTKVAALQWVLTHHPDVEADRVGSARVYGQIAFAEACAGRRTAALRWAWRASRRRPREWRAVVAAAVACRLVTGDRVLSALHSHGRGV